MISPHSNWRAEGRIDLNPIGLSERLVEQKKDKAKSNQPAFERGALTVKPAMRIEYANQ